MNAYKKLINNSALFAIGNLGSKLVSFLLVPLYSYYLSTAEYGSIDLLMTTINLLIPIVSLSAFDAVLRFTMEKGTSREEILTNSLFIAMSGFAISIVFFPLIATFIGNKSLIIPLYVILIVQIIERIFAQYARGIGLIKIYAIYGILSAFLLSIFNIIFVVFLELGIFGYIYSIILTSLLAILFLGVNTKIYSVIKFNSLSKIIMKKLLSYAAPLIPNSLMWWLINASGRYFITFFLGMSFNGLYAVASKIPAIINIANQVFTQAWQLSAIEEYDKKDSEHFNSKVFSVLQFLLFTVTSIIIAIIKPFFSLLDSSYFVAWKVVPLLILSTVFSSFSGFIGANYVAAKSTIGVFKTSVYGGIISLVLNYILIPRYGLVGAGLSSMISFFITFYIRYQDTQKFVSLRIDWFKMIGSLIIIFIQTIFLYLNIAPNVILELLSQLIFIIALLIFNKDILKSLSLLLKTEILKFYKERR